MIKAFLGDNWLVIVVAVGALALGLGFGSKYTNYRWESRWEARNAANELAKAEMERQHRETERKLYDDLQKQLEISDQRRAESQRLQSDARDALDSLHGENAALRLRLQRAGELASHSSAIPSATRAAMVLSELFDRCSAERQELAGAFDEARSRGLNVERMYDKARGQ